MKAAKKQLSDLIRSNPGLKIVASTYGWIVICLIISFLVNYLLIVKQVNMTDWIARVELARLFILEGVSPYDLVESDLASLSVLVDIQIGNTAIFPFKSPVFGLFLLFPFSLIPNIALSYSIWLTINQALLVLALYWLIDLFSWKIGREIRIFLVFFISFAYFSIANYLNPGFSMMQLFFLVMGIRSIYLEDDILAGVALALTLVSPINVILPALIIILSLLRNRRFFVITWFGITLLLVSLAGIIFDSSWPIKLIRNIISHNNLVILYSFQPVINLIPEGLRFPYIRLIIPLGLISWLYFEFIQTRVDHVVPNLWIIGLSICVNTLVFFHHALDISILFSFLFVLIFYLWHRRVVNKTLLIFFAISSAAINFIPFFLTNRYSDFKDPFFSVYQLVMVIFLVIMLYWVKWWVADESILPD